MPRSITHTLYAMMLCLLLHGVATAQMVTETSELKGVYQPPTINNELFTEDLSMTNQEREDYAKHIIVYALDRIHRTEGDQKALNFTTKSMGLALYLSPRNKLGLVANAQLKEGVMPQRAKAEYEDVVFSGLLLTRGLLLENQEGDANALVSRCLLSLAATINPRNEDAVFEAEIRRIDDGEIDWTVFTGNK